jgi:hypothetical protein
MKQRAGVIGRDVLRGVWCDANAPQAPMITGDLQRAAWPSPFRPASAPILFGCQGLGQTFSFAHGTRKMKGYALTIRRELTKSNWRLAFSYQLLTLQYSFFIPYLFVHSLSHRIECLALSTRKTSRKANSGATVQYHSRTASC